ncbi:MAG TPA: PH domain-containing protein [Bryobacterales bacterium]|nr:PH domain-containing protein [Bryobacterales bacterium]
MTTPIAGVVPLEEKEVTVATFWPSIAVYPFGRTIGRLGLLAWPGVYIFRIGYLLAVLCIPIAIALYFLRLAPRFGRRYVLSNRRIAVKEGITDAEIKSLDLDRFDTIDIVTHPGDAWYHCGDLVFREGKVETFRLNAVPRPEVARETFLQARLAYVGVRNALAGTDAA